MASINNMINNAQRTDITTVLNSVWTDNKDFCCPLMGDAQMITDMVEVQDLIAALSVAESRGIAIPKLQATECPYSYDENGWQAINVEIMGPVTDDFMSVMDGIQSGEFGLKDVTSEGNIRWIRDSIDMKNFVLSFNDNINIINETMR